MCMHMYAYACTCMHMYMYAQLTRCRRGSPECSAVVCAGSRASISEDLPRPPKSKRMKARVTKERRVLVTYSINLKASARPLRHGGGRRVRRRC